MKAHWNSIAAAALLIVSAAHARADEALAKKSGCLECHSIDKNANNQSIDRKPIGPAFHDIAAKYQDMVRARTALIETVKKGGKGNWTAVTGGTTMPPYSPRLSDAEINRLVDWVLGL